MLVEVQTKGFLTSIYDPDTVTIADMEVVLVGYINFYNHIGGFETAKRIIASFFVDFVSSYRNEPKLSKIVADILVSNNIGTLERVLSSYISTHFPNRIDLVTQDLVRYIYRVTNNIQESKVANTLYDIDVATTDEALVAVGLLDVYGNIYEK